MSPAAAIPTGSPPIRRRPRTPPRVDRLLAAGADLIGKTITDELAYSLNGQNFHYGTPVNSNAPGRVPCGSSSGSAAAVAGAAADFALGSDTGGSVRVPAAVCGIYGIRPSHGRVAIDGVMPLAASFDTVGWFARDARVLARVGGPLLGEDTAHIAGGAARIADAFALAAPAVQAALESLAARVEGLMGRRSPMEIGGLEDWMIVFRKLQAREIWAQHGAWVEQVRPRFGPEIAARFEWARAVSAQPPGPEAARRTAFGGLLAGMLRDKPGFCCCRARRRSPPGSACKGPRPRASATAPSASPASRGWLACLRSACPPRPGSTAVRSGCR